MLVVGHKPEVVAIAAHIIDLGPRAGACEETETARRPPTLRCLARPISQLTGASLTTPANESRSATSSLMQAR